MSRSVCLTIALSCTCAEAAFGKVDNLFVRPRVSLMPSGVGQMLPTEAYRTAFQSMSNQEKTYNAKAAKALKIAMEGVSQRSLMQRAKAVKLAKESHGENHFLSPSVTDTQQPQSIGDSLPMGKLIDASGTEEDISRERLPDHLGNEEKQPMLESTPVLSETKVHEEKIQAAADHVIAVLSATQAASVAQDEAEKAVKAAAVAEVAVQTARAASMLDKAEGPDTKPRNQGAAAPVLLDPESNVAASELAKKKDVLKAEEHHEVASLKKAAEAARNRADSLDLAAEAVELQSLSGGGGSIAPAATIDEEAQPDPVTKDLDQTATTVKTTISSNMASNAAKIAIDAAKNAAQHAQEAQDAVDTVKEVVAVSLPTNSSKDTESASATSKAAANESGKAAGKAAEKHGNSPSSGSSISVPAQVTQGMHIAPTQIDEAKDAEEAGQQDSLKKKEAGTKQKVATAAANDANEVAQEASQVAQEEAANAAMNAAQAAEAGAEASAVNAVDANKVEPSISPASGDAPKEEPSPVQEQAQKVADDKAHEAQQAAIRAAVAAKVAEQKGHEATVAANEATEASADAKNDAPVDVPMRGLVISLLLGLVITIIMLGGLLSLFAAGDKLLKAADRDRVTQGTSTKTLAA